jgi:hypothetical protein
LIVRYSELLDMGLKVIHIDRRKIDFEARAREFWETVLKPKWEKRSRAQAEKLMAKLIRDSKVSTPEFTTPKERIIRCEKVKIVIDVDGNSLNIKCITKIGVK